MTSSVGTTNACLFDRQADARVNLTLNLEHTQLYYGRLVAL